MPNHFLAHHPIRNPIGAPRFLQREARSYHDEPSPQAQGERDQTLSAEQLGKRFTAIAVCRRIKRRMPTFGTGLVFAAICQAAVFAIRPLKGNRPFLPFDGQVIDTLIGSIGGWPMLDFILESPRLGARPWRLDDAAAAFKIYGDREVTQFLSIMSSETEAAAAERISRILERDRQWGGRMGSWALIERATTEVIGCVLIKPLPDDERIEVGWHLARSKWGNGYATEAGKTALEYGFEELGQTAIYAIVEPGNHASINVCRRLGMTRLGLTSQYYDRELEFFAKTRQ